MNKKNWHLDRFAVAFIDSNTQEETWVETHFNEDRAHYYCKIINDHELNNSRPARYYVIPV